MNPEYKPQVILIVIAIIGSLFLYTSTKSIEEEISVAYNEKKSSDIKLKIYTDIDNYFGRVSEKFYASKPVIILRGEGAKDTVDIYRENKSAMIAYRNTSMFETSWSDNKDGWEKYNVAAKISSGYGKISFENEATKEIFSVLVIIK
ncbi:MAG: hypothetical protein IJT73_01060 [Selenomonadaceae bacterium]|nr:hypothetical protein [Selenomonadaceae bacterium]